MIINNNGKTKTTRISKQKEEKAPTRPGPSPPALNHK